MSYVSKRLVQLKNERKLLQKDIAHGSGLSLRGYQNYERGEREPNANALVALANYFDVSLDSLTGAGLYSKEQQVLKHKDKISDALNLFYNTNFFTQVSTFPDSVFMAIVAATIKDIDFLDNEDASKITLYPLIPAEAGSDFFSTLK